MNVATEAKRPTSATLATRAARFTRKSTRSPSDVPSWISTSENDALDRCSVAARESRCGDSNPRRKASSVPVGCSSSASTTRPRCQRIHGEARCVTSSMLPCSVSPVLSSMAIELNSMPAWKSRYRP